MDPGELFANLDSNQPHLAEDAKKKLHQTLNMTKESWLLNGIFDYYLVTNSARCIEILVSVREPHDKYLFDRLCEALKGTAKLQALTVLGHVLRKQPGWLYKITQHQLLRDLLKLLKTEMEILPLLSALLAVVVLLPMIPALMGPYLQDVFDIFSRLVAWNCNPGRLAEEQLVHLQVTMYALFLRLYGMYPCNFISYLRNHYKQSDNKPVFMHTVRPMLSTVLIHPHLVTASKDHETDTVRWKKMGHHDVIVECERFAVETADRGREEQCYTGLTSSFRSRSGTDHSSDSSPFTLPAFKFPIYSSGPTDKEFWSPSIFFHQHSNSPPPLPEVSAPTSIPQTPNSISSSVFPQQEGTSPPEAAIEATPETTPIKDVLSGRASAASVSTSGGVRTGPPIGSAVARALTGLGGGVSSGGPGTPSGSQPGSPMRKDASPFRFPHESSSSAFELSQRRHNAGVSQKIARIIEDRSQVSETLIHTRGRTPQLQPTSPSRVIPRQDTGSIPNSPVPLLESGGGSAAMHWQLARPKPDRVSSPGIVLTSSASNAVSIIGAMENTSQEDQEVVEIVRQGEQFQDKIQRQQQCDSVLQEFQISHDEEYDECEQEHGSPCTSGGLHMPNSHSLQAFATRVKRLRYYSQCAPDTARNDFNDHNGQNITLSNNIKVRRANSCPEMKKNYPSIAASESLGKGALDESDELSIETSSTPVPETIRHEMSNGLDRRKISASTQTLDLWPMPYEHLFLGVFPLMEMSSEIRPSPAPSPAPYSLTDNSHKSIRWSPYEMLDKYIEHAAHMVDCPPDRYSNKVSSPNPDSEVRVLREQLGLLYLQLQYERHRREVHAIRNRRLLGESRSNKALDEHNSALRDQLCLLQKEIENLHDQLNLKKQDSVMRERELQEIVRYWHGLCLMANDENKNLREKNEMLQKTLSEQQQLAKENSERYQRTEARLFQVESEMNIALAQARDSQKIIADLERMRMELLLAGELNQRYREKLEQLPLVSHKEDEMALFTAVYHEEINNLNQQLESKNALVESYQAHITDLESQTREFDEMCASQKRMLKQVKEEYHEQLRAVESKYETQRSINKCMEERVLELWQRLEDLHATQQRRQATGHHSPDTSSCHEAIVAGVVSGGASTTAGGGSGSHSGPALSPQSSPPLSASLASSEESMRAFLQQQHSSGLSHHHGELREIKNLQVIVNQSESESRISYQLSSEDTTPDGTARSLSSLNHSE